MATTDIKITLTERAARTLREAQLGGDSEVIRFSVTPEFRHGLQLGAPDPAHLVVDVDGIAIHIDPDSARRADGVRIDFVPGKDGGFRIENPNEPRRVHLMQPHELKFRIDAGERIEVIDVRPAEERAQAKIEGAKPLDEAAAHLDKVDPNSTIVFYCHRGGRGEKVANQYLDRGFRNVYNLQGGIDAWSLAVDASIPRY